MGQKPGRIESLDALRGFALFGILLINIQVFSGYSFTGPEGRAALSGSAYDAQLGTLLDVAVRAKFYSLFSLLFGYSFVMLARRVDAPTRHHLRRMLGLLVIGLLHSVLLWPWDILLLYALAGICLTPFLRLGPGTLFAWSLAVLAVTAAGRWLWLDLGLPPTRGELATDLLQAHVPAFATGDYGEVVNANAQLAVGVLVERLEGLRPLRVFALFLLGAAAARLRLAEADTGHRLLLGLGALVALPAGLLLAVLEFRLSSGGTPTSAFYVLAETLAPPLVAAGYACLLWGIWRTGNRLAAWTRALLAPAGRMALTNYLGQSAICVPAFYGFGLGWFAELSLGRQMLFAVALFAGQLLFSYLWLKCFRQGPIEWLWRWQIKGQRPTLMGGAI